MFLDRVFYQNDILEAAMHAAALRGAVLSNNIANADTPGYKRSEVTFEDSLADALTKFRNTGELDLSRCAPGIRAVNTNLSYRKDGNNVDMQTEMVDFYNNTMRYNSMAQGVMNNYKRMNLALTLR